MFSNSKKLAAIIVVYFSIMLFKLFNFNIHGSQMGKNFNYEVGSIKFLPNLNLILKNLSSDLLKSSSLKVKLSPLSILTLNPSIDKIEFENLSFVSPINLMSLANLYNIMNLIPDFEVCDSFIIQHGEKQFRIEDLMKQDNLISFITNNEIVSIEILENSLLFKINEIQIFLTKKNGIYEKIHIKSNLNKSTKINTITDFRPITDSIAMELLPLLPDLKLKNNVNKHIAKPIESNIMDNSNNEQNEILLNEILLNEEIKHESSSIELIGDFKFDENKTTIDNIKIISDSIIGSGRLVLNRDELLGKSQIKLSFTKLDQRAISENLNANFLNFLDFVLAHNIKIYVDANQFKLGSIEVDNLQLSGHILNKNFQIDQLVGNIGDEYKAILKGSVRWDTLDWISNGQLYIIPNYLALSDYLNNAHSSSINDENSKDKYNQVSNLQKNYWYLAAKFDSDEIGFFIKDLNIKHDLAKITGYFDYNYLGNDYSIDSKLFIDNLDLDHIFDFKDLKDYESFIVKLGKTKCLARYQINGKNITIKGHKVEEIKTDLNIYDGRLDSNSFYIKDDNVILGNVLIVSDPYPKIILDIQDGYLNLNPDNIINLLKYIPSVDTEIFLNTPLIKFGNNDLKNVKAIFKAKDSTILIEQLKFDYLNGYLKLKGIVNHNPWNFRLLYQAKNLNISDLLPIPIPFNYNFDLDGKIITYGKNIDELVFNSKISSLFHIDKLKTNEFDLDNLAQTIRTKNFDNIKSSLYLNEGILNKVNGNLRYENGNFLVTGITFETLQTAGLGSMKYNLYTKMYEVDSQINFYLDFNSTELFTVDLKVDNKQNQIRNTQINFDKEIILRNN